MKRVFHFRASLSRLGPLEQRLLEALWERGHATVRDLLKREGACRDLAYTTVMTTLDRLFKKNLLSREAEGRAFRYAPRFTREELHREIAGEAVRQLKGRARGRANQGQEARATNHRPPNFYPRPTPTYSNPSARSRVESSRFLVSTIIGFLSKCLMRSKSSARNSGQPVPTTRASEPSAAA